MKTIVKYANRKLYDKETSRYTTVAELATQPLGTFRVVQYDKPFEEDITTEILFQALLLKNITQYIKIEIMKYCTEQLNGELLLATEILSRMEGEKDVTEVQS
jgi:polyhydroxyalkanoate synthesis regulator protein